MASPLGDFLRHGREALSPTDVGLPNVGQRRVPGLRREEVSLLAGVSVDYYVRLEQGRERTPSVQVLDALGAVLQLDDDSRLHLFRLAGVAPAPSRTGVVERVDPALLQLMQAWPNHPALVLGRAYDVLAQNALGDALFYGFPGSRNLILKMFLDEDSRVFYTDWERAAANTVAGFRLLHGTYGSHPRFKVVIDELSARSPDFVQMWAGNTVKGKTLEVKTFLHPQVGELTVRMLAFDVRSSPGQQLVVYQAEPGTPSEEALLLLGSLSATARAMPPPVDQPPRHQGLTKPASASH